jgi:glycosyltransferase involved in cell wall biosynthesis
MNSDYPIDFFFQQNSDVKHDFEAIISTRNRVAGFEPWGCSWNDIRLLGRHIKETDVVISSFVRNCFTYYALFFAGLYRKPIIVWDEWMRLNRAKVRYMIRDKIGRSFFPLIDCIYVMGPRQEDLFKKLGFPPDRIFTANEYPGYIYSNVEKRPIELGVGAKNQIILYLGRLIEVKGINYLIESFQEIKQRHQDAVLVIVGDGPERTRLQDLANRIDRRDIRFLGSIVDIHQKAFLLQRANVAVIPSIETDTKSDPGPLATLEVLSAGTPLVISKSVGNSSFVKEGTTGYIVPQKCASELAKAISRVLSGGVGNREVILREFAAIPGFENQKRKMDEAIRKALPI